HRRHRAEDRFAASARLESEQRAAVVDEIELDVSSAPPCLERALALAVGFVAMTQHDRRVGVEEGIADRAQQREAVREAALVQVVEEDAADAARLVAVLQKEVFVAPALEARIEIVAEGLKRLLAHAVEAYDVLLERIVGREIHAAAEPPYRRVAVPVRPGDEEAHVHVHGGHVRVARMQYER